MHSALSFLFAKEASAQLSFAALGNWGSGSWTQKTVSSSLDSACASHNCSFVVSPGSNFVGGVQDLQDVTYNEAFASVYTGKNVSFPFYTSLGVEDWRFNVTSEALYSQLTYGTIRNGDPVLEGELAEDKPGVDQIEISRGTSKFTLPNWWYTYSTHYSEESKNSLFGASDKSVAFVFIDTYILSADFPAEDFTEKHWNELKTSLLVAKASFDWTIVVGDAAIYSSGKNGGSSEMQMKLRPLLKETGVHAYISGSDYDMEILADGDLTLLNCGNGSSASGMGMRTAPGSIKFIGKPGFCLLKLQNNRLIVDLVDGSTGISLHTEDIEKVSKNISVFERAKGNSSMPATEFVPLPWGIGGSIGPNGEGGVLSPGVLTFIKVVGTCGLAISAFVIFIAILTSATRIHKCATN